MLPGSRWDNITSFIVMDVLEKAHELERAGKHVIHLEIGQPDFSTPECVKEAAIKAIRDGKTKYTHSLGIIELREAICREYHERYGVTVHPDQVVVTPGTSPAMLLSFAALLSPGDTVVVSDPHYACYPNFIRFAGGEPSFVPVSESDGFQYRVRRIERLVDQRTKAVLVNSPANPTGTLTSADRLRRLAGLGLTMVSDEIYHGLVYEGTEHSALEFTEDCFVFNGFSKRYAMTGWRLGYAIAPRAYIPVMQRMQQNFFICTGSVAQWAGVAALTDAGDDVARMRLVFDQRRRLLLDRLGSLGFTTKVEPTGAFYVFVDASWINPDSVELAFDILDKALVGVTPGLDFGPGGQGYLRFSYANSLENIEMGMERLRGYLERRGHRVSAAG